MSIPCYLALEWKDFVNNMSGLPAQLGFGFREDGSARVPDERIENALIVIDDRIMPEKGPSEKALAELAALAKNGCMLDFERPVSPIGAAIIEGLQAKATRGQLFVVPEQYHDLFPKATVCVTAQLCNHWESLVRRAEKRYGNNWVLEEIPQLCVMALTCETGHGVLPSAVLRYQAGNGVVRYYDTARTLAIKRQLAEAHGCRAVFGLMCEHEVLEEQ